MTGIEPEPFELGEHLVEASGKLVLIDRLLNYLKTTGHKVLMFSQMTHMLDILQDYLGYRGICNTISRQKMKKEYRYLNAIHIIVFILYFLIYLLSVFELVGEVCLY